MRSGSISERYCGSRRMLSGLRRPISENQCVFSLPTLHGSQHQRLDDDLVKISEVSGSVGNIRTQILNCQTRNCHWWYSWIVGMWSLQVLLVNERWKTSRNGLEYTYLNSYSRLIVPRYASAVNKRRLILWAYKWKSWETKSVTVGPILYNWWKGTHAFRRQWREFWGNVINGMCIMLKTKDFCVTSYFASFDSWMLYMYSTM